MKFKNLSVIAISLLLSLSGCDSTTTSSGGTGDGGSSTKNGNGGGSTNNGGGSNNGGGTNNGGTNQGGTTLKEDFTFRIGTQKSTSVDFKIDNVRVSYTNFDVLLEPTHGALHNISGYMYYDANGGFYGDDFIKVKSLSDSKVYVIKIVVFDQRAYDDDISPSFRHISTLLAKNTSIDLNLSAIDSDDPQTNIKYTLVSSPAHGSLSGELPFVKYSVDSDYLGSDSFSYMASDLYKDSKVSDANFTIIDKAQRVVKPVDGVGVFTRDANNVVSDNYTKLKWYDKDFDNDALTFTEAQSYCENLDVGGVSNWRIPYKKDIKTLFDHNASDKYTYTDTLSNIQLYDGHYRVYYWVSDEDDFLYNNAVPFDASLTFQLINKATTLCVSGDEYTQTSMRGDGIVYSLEYGLAFYKSEDKMDYSQAKPFCENLQYKGYDDWYLGNIHELSIGKSFLWTSNGIDYSWSTTDSFVDDTKTYAIDSYGSDIYDKNSSQKRALCIRSLFP